MQKKCNSCEIIQSIENFRWIPSTDRYYPRCKPCEKAQRHELYMRNKQKILDSNRNWRQKNQDKVKQSKHAYYVANKEACDARSKQWRLDHIEHCRQRDREYHRKHRDARLQAFKQYHKNNLNRIKMRKKEFYQAHKNSILTRNREYYKINIQFRIASSLRRRMRNCIKSGKRAGELLGCTLEFLTIWFEFNFAIDGDDFTWETYGTNWEIDHIMPCKNFDLTDENQMKTCFHWTNLSPTTVTHNRSKNQYVSQIDCIRQEIRIKLFLKDHSIK